MSPVKFGFAVASAALSLGVAPALATTISVAEFSTSSFDALVATGTFGGEDFETLGTTLGEGEVGIDFATSVGTFNTLGGTGGGGTVSGLPGNTGTELALRDGNVFGRVNTVPTGGSWYLDSNDTQGIHWDVATGDLFNTVIFTLVDGSDTGAYLRISTDGESYEQRVGGKLANGNASIVVVSFGAEMSTALIELGNYTSNGSDMRTNDGFSIDGLRVGNVAPVPLPATGLLLAGALGFAGWRARKQRG
jgi:hypothetical protein